MDPVGPSSRADQRLDAGRSWAIGHDLAIMEESSSPHLTWWRRGTRDGTAPASSALRMARRMLGRVSRFWSVTLRLFYRVITRLQPLVRPWATRVGLGNVVELIVTGRRSGRRRVVLLGLLRVDNGWYLGHPNGPVNWTRNLDAAGSATLAFAHQPSVEIRPELLPIGDERRRVIAATWHQHVFPGNVIYWLARGHIFAVGRYYRIEPLRPLA